MTPTWRTLDRLEVARPLWLLERPSDPVTTTGWRRVLRTIARKARPS